MGEGRGGGERLDTNGGGLVQSVGYCRAHTLGVVQHLVVPEPQHAVPLAFQKLRAACFRGGRWVVLPAIDLDDQSRFMADKIGQ